MFYLRQGRAATERALGGGLRGHHLTHFILSSPECTQMVFFSKAPPRSQLRTESSLRNCAGARGRTTKTKFPSSAERRNILAAQKSWRKCAIFPPRYKRCCLQAFSLRLSESKILKASVQVTFKTLLMPLIFLSAFAVKIFANFSRGKISQFLLV